MRILAISLVSLILALAAGCDRLAQKAAEPADHHGEGAKAGHESVVTLPEASQKLIGLATAVVAVQAVRTSLSTTGEIVPNPDREAHVTTRVPGRVVSIRRTLGDTVRAGERLALLESIELGQAEADFLEAQARADLARKIARGSVT
jgi:cobalt-zinc-cadmium efflux system membrane fusion protein